VNEWFNHVFFESGPSWVTLPAAFLVGMLGAMTSACNLALIGGMVGHSGLVGEKQDRRGVLVASAFFMLGTVVALGIIGAATGFVGQAAGAVLGGYWKVVAGAVILVIGLISLNLIHVRIPALSLDRFRGSHGITGSMVFGLALGGGTATCAIGCNPLLPMVLGFTTLQGAPGWSAAILAAFAVGYGLPLAIAIAGLGLGFGKLSRLATRLTPLLRVASGLLLFVVGIYLIYSGVAALLASSAPAVKP